MIKLTIEGLPDEVDTFLSELYGSVPQPAHQEKDIEDRIIKKQEQEFNELARFLRIRQDEGNRKIWDEIKNLKVTAPAGEGLDALFCGTCHCSPCKCPDSVPKAPEIKDQYHDRKQKLDLSKLPTKEDMLIPRFEWKRECEKNYNTLIFAELPDGRVMLSYMSAKVFTTKEKVMQIPFPVPPGYLKKCGAPNNVTALLQYRKYLAKHSVHAGAGDRGPQQDRKEKDLDEPFKPKLRGVFSTHPSEEDGKVEGSLEE